MLNCNKQAGQGETIISLEGELDTVASLALEKELGSLLDGAENVKIDMAKLEYITSAGLRMLAQIRNILAEKEGSLTLVHVSEEIREIFDVTGFTDILTIE